jgi:hypothetical protein
VFTTSYLTHAPLARFLAAHPAAAHEAAVLLSPGRAVGLRLVPMERDLRFLWEELPQQILDEQAQKVRDSLRGALIAWAREQGEGSDYRDNVPLQCLHPVGHFYEVPNLLGNGVLQRLLREEPGLEVLLVHNVDTLGATVDPRILGAVLESDAALTFEVVPRWYGDEGGGLARVDGRLRLVEGLALPRPELAQELTCYSTMTCWVHVDRLLETFGLGRDDLAVADRVRAAVRRVADRLPTYVTLKEVKTSILWRSSRSCGET